ncbi:hypothetical protein RRG08_061701 [Elysia crispata]|uniref:Uncharacterized protein n=1 Tax=Elysia crispata TaxID=231223 RepID=A0AAE1A5H0_9GAST|nr:hypothetical protein RRG08_061701 [Elysia crispata]
MVLLSIRSSSRADLAYSKSSYNHAKQVGLLSNQTYSANQNIYIPSSLASANRMIGLVPFQLAALEESNANLNDSADE